MRFFIAFLLTALLAFIAGLWTPWWMIVVISFLVAMLIHQRPWKAMLAGFLAIFALWGTLAQWMDSENNSILSSKIAEILPLSGNSFLLILVTAFIGGLVGALGALTGSYLRRSK